MGIALHTVPHPVSLIVDVVDPIAVDFGASVDNLARPDPLLVFALLRNERSHVVNLPEVVHFERVLRIDLLRMAHRHRFLEHFLEVRLGLHLLVGIAGANGD